MSKSKAEKVQSNSDHHKTFFLPDYKEFKFKFALILNRAVDMIVELEKLERQCKNLEINRRENAVAMGVGIKESDEIYNMDALLKEVPVIAKRIREIEGMFK